MKTIYALLALVFLLVAHGVVGRLDYEDEMRFQLPISDPQVLSLDCVERQPTASPKQPSLSRLASFSAPPQTDAQRRLECLVAKESSRAR